MGDLERAVEWLRPFIDSKAWDYCIVWKLGDDPSRFIEWLGCCCSGGVGTGNYDHVKTKEESREEQKSTPFCRDDLLKHPVRTMACEALAEFPSFMALYSGIHGEVVTTNQPKWLSHANASDSSPSHESIATRVLIPVFGGLIELFAAKHIPKDQNIIELVIAKLNVSIEHKFVPEGSYASVSLDEQCLDRSLEENLHNFASAMQLLTFIPRIQVLPAVVHPNYEGLYTGSNPSIEHPSLDSNCCYIAQKVPLKQSISKSSGSKRQYFENQSSGSKRPEYENHVLKEEMGLVLDCKKNEGEKDNKGGIQRLGKENYRSKNLITERKRRNKIKDGLFALRALVPNISKMDRAAILGDAVEYIRELERKVEELQYELKENEEDCQKDNAELKSPKPDDIDEGTRYLHPTDHCKSSPECGEKRNTEVQVEVNQIDKRDFLIKLFCEHKQVGFVKLMEAINSLELQVLDANITTFNDKVLNILRVEAHKENIRPKKLRDSLIELTGNVTDMKSERGNETERVF